MTADKDNLKNDVREFWDEKPCGTHTSDKERYTKDYFEEIENKRYSMQPEIFSFAQFSRFKDKKLLEVGVGAGSDFLQWVRAGTKAYGIDLTDEAVQHVKHRLSLYGLEAEQIITADSENLPFEDDTFDIVYSWGVIHHTPDTEKAMKEIIRVCKPGGKCKVMIYHRKSLLAWFFWIKHALLKMKPWLSVADILWNHMESIGTKAYTKYEVEQMLKTEKIKNVRIKPVLSYYDRLERFSPIMQRISKIAAALLGGDRVGWQLTIEFDKE